MRKKQEKRGKKQEKRGKKQANQWEKWDDGRGSAHLLVEVDGGVVPAQQKNRLGFVTDADPVRTEEGG